MTTKEFKLNKVPRRVLELLDKPFTGKTKLLAESLNKDPATISRILKKLCAVGLVDHSTPEESDHRVKLFFITRKGHDLLKGAR